MCDGFSEAALVAGAVASAAGAAVSYQAGQNAQAASRTAQAQASAAQQQAFQSRVATQQAQLAGQTALNDQTNQKFGENQAAQQAAQEGALGDRAAALTKLNTQQAAVSDAENQAVKTNLTPVTADGLAAAQVGQAANQNALAAPGVAALQANNPLGEANTGSTKIATDASDAAAAKYADHYGTSLAKLSAYNAPVTTTNQAAVSLGTALAPLASQDTLNKFATPTLLAPSSVAYQNSGQYGQAVQQANQITSTRGEQVNDLQAQNGIDLATLRQTDRNAVIQGQLNLKQGDAAAQAGLGQGLSAVGSTAISAGAGRGAFSGLLASFNGPAPAATPARKVY